MPISCQSTLPRPVEVMDRRLNMLQYHIPSAVIPQQYRMKPVATKIVKPDMVDIPEGLTKKNFANIPLESVYGKG